MKFPRDHTRITVGPAPELVSRFPGQKSLYLYKVEFLDNAHATIDGFGVPFADPSNPELEVVLNNNAPIVDNLGLLDFFRQQSFRLVITGKLKTPELFSMDRLPETFSYPYGPVAAWNEELYSRLLDEHKGKKAFIRAN